MPYIKEKFFKGRNSKLGSGIGLSICDEIIGMMGGSLAIYSTENKGTKVVIRIPCVLEGVCGMRRKCMADSWSPSYCLWY